MAPSSPLEFAHYFLANSCPTIQTDNRQTVDVRQDWHGVQLFSVDKVDTGRFFNGGSLSAPDRSVRLTDTQLLTDNTLTDRLALTDSSYQ